MNSYVGAISQSTHSVLAKTFSLVGFSMIPTILGAFLVSQIPNSYYMLHPSLAMWGGIGLFLLSLGLMFFAMRQRNPTVAISAFMLFAFVIGCSIGPVIMVALQQANGFQIVLDAAALTALSLWGLTAYAVYSKKDFSFLGGFLFVGLLLLIGSMFLSFFIHSSVFYLTINAVGVLIFLGYILFDVSRIVRGGETNYIFAAIQIYLDIINLFMNILSILLILTGNKK